MKHKLTGTICIFNLLIFFLLPAPTPAQPPVCHIQANGQSDEIQVDFGAGISVGVGLDPNDETSAPADWWLARMGPDGLKWMDIHAMPYSVATPVYRGPLFYIESGTTIMNLEGLVSGDHILFFGVDLLSNGMLDMDQLYYGAVKVTVGSSPRRQRLEAADFWMYQIQDLDADGALDALARTNYPLLVIEPGHNLAEYPYDTAAMVDALSHTPEGLQRVLLAYIDIGQAEDYRTYWKSDWQLPSAGASGYPDFLLAPDPDGWSGNFQVAYWREDWRNIWLGDSGIVAELARYGFDGVYLDWVEAYDDESVQTRAETDGVSPEMEMIRLIEDIKSAGQAVSPGFLVVAQNAPYLIDEAPERYGAAIDALAVEDTWFHGEGDAEWDDPNAGDLHERHDDDYSTESRLAQYEKYLDRGIPVFSVDYCISEQNARDVYEWAGENGLRPLVTRVSLSRITETPHELADHGE